MKTLRQYEIVIEIARWGSISRAAESLNIAQPTVSKILQKLESSLNVELFDRTTIPIRLTGAGQRYVEAGHKILDADHQFMKELEEIKSHQNEEVTIGISPSRAGYLLPELIAEYKHLAGDHSRIVVRERNIAQLNVELMRGDLDLIINLVNDGTSEFSKVHLFTETTFLAIPEDCTEEDPETILKTLPVVSIGAGLRMWKAMKRILDDMGGIKPAIECQAFESALGLVKRGLGVTLVPSYMAGYSDRNVGGSVRFIKLSEEFYRKYGAYLERQVCIFYRKEQFLTSAEKTFIDACLEVARKMQK